MVRFRHAWTTRGKQRSAFQAREENGVFSRILFSFVAAARQEMETLDHAVLRRSPAENGPEGRTEGRISSAPDRQADAGHSMNEIFHRLKILLKTGTFRFLRPIESSKMKYSHENAATGHAGHSRCPPLVGRMISVLPRLDQQEVILPFVTRFQSVSHYFPAICRSACSIRRFTLLPGEQISGDPSQSAQRRSRRNAEPVDPPVFSG